MPPKTHHRWAPIEDLPEDWRSLANPQVSALVDAWLAQAEMLRQTASYSDFLVKLRREWAIETGFIERLYRISEGATKTLIERGLDAALLLHEDLGRSPQEVIAIIKDQNSTIEGLYQFVSGERELGKSYLHELHQALTAHQLTYEVIDTQGRPTEQDLPRGIWKKWPNNVGDPAGVNSLEFCPPEQVDTEIERLLRWHRDHDRLGVPPDVEAAWLHHRFTLIHPYADGNGRVARCLASLVLLKARWFPLVVTRRDEGYIGALRAADGGDLKPLVALVGSLQNRAVLKAFGLSDGQGPTVKPIAAILGAVKDKFERDRLAEEPGRGQVLAIGDALHRLASLRMAELAKEVNETIQDLGPGFGATSGNAGRSEAQASRYDVLAIALGGPIDYFVNDWPFHAWVDLSITMRFRVDIQLSIHGVGRGFSGVLAAKATAYAKFEDDDGRPVYRDFKPLSEEPFLFTYAEREEDVVSRFRPWLEERLVLGLDHWRNLIGA